MATSTQLLIPEYLMTINRFPGDGTTEVFDINFAGGYLSRTHVRGYVENTETTEVIREVVIQPEDWLGPFQIRVLPAVQPGETLVIYRDTPRDLPLVDFVDGAILNSTNLNTNSKQAVFVSAEMRDRVSNYNADVSTAVATAISARDAALEAAADAENAAQDSQGFAVSAQAAAAQAQSSASSAQSAADAAQGHASAAEASEEATALSADEADAARLAAEAARDSAQAAALAVGVYDNSASVTVPSGVDPGDSYWVIDADGNGLTLYDNDAGSPVLHAPLVQMPLAGSVAEVTRQIMQDPDHDMACVVDARGFVGFSIDGAGKISGYLDVDENQIGLGTNAIIFDTEDVALAAVDAHGFAIFYVMNDGQTSIDGSGGGETMVNAVGADFSTMIETAGRYDAHAARPAADYNVFLVYGQSLAEGVGGNILYSTTQQFGNLMYGDGITPASRADPAFVPQTSDAFYPLTANAAVNAKENVGVGFTNAAKRFHNHKLVLENDTQRLFVATCTAVAGKSIAELSKGASPDLYQRNLDAMTGIKNLADGESKTSKLAGIISIQGEADYALGISGATYRAALDQLYADLVADAQSIFGQTDIPPIFIVQTRTNSANADATEMGIGTAQYEFAEETETGYLVGPYYQVPDTDGTHLTSNGYRWIAMQCAKVWNKIQMGQGWRPLTALRATVEGDDNDQIVIDFHVPAPPLQWRVAYVDGAATDYTAKGFAVSDSAGAAGISSVEIEAGCRVRLSLARSVSGTITVTYAGYSTFDGNGNLADSDGSVATELFTWQSGDHANDDIPELIGRPYPLNNFSIAFRIQTSI